MLSCAAKSSVRCGACVMSSAVVAGVIVTQDSRSRPSSAMMKRSPPTWVMPSGSSAPCSGKLRSSRPSGDSSATCGGRLVTVNSVPVAAEKVRPETLSDSPSIFCASMAAR